MMISVVFLKNLYYSTFLLPKTILIFGLYVTFVYGYKSCLLYTSKWQKGKVAIDMKFTDKHPYAVRPEGNFQLQSISRSSMKLGVSRFRTIPRRNNAINM